jgi:hypothetical protein
MACWQLRLYKPSWNKKVFLNGAHLSQRQVGTILHVEPRRSGFDAAQQQTDAGHRS